LRFGDELILVDAGDGATEQLAKVGVPIQAVTTLFISHHHFDHIGGLFALLGMRYQVIAPNVLTIYGPPGTKAIVDGLLKAMEPAALSGSVIRARAARGPADTVRVVEIADGAKLTIGSAHVIAASNSHYTVLAGPKSITGPVSLSFRFDLPDRSIVYTGDTGPSANVENLARGADLLVSEVIDVDATLAELKRSRHDLGPDALKFVEAHFRAEHLAPAEAAKLARAAHVKALVLTHIGIEPDGIEAARSGITVIYKGPVTFANDLEKF
jgi:ribonuclease BN (tRNA processing enzyme)